MLKIIYFISVSYYQTYVIKIKCLTYCVTIYTTLYFHFSVKGEYIKQVVFQGSNSSSSGVWSFWYSEMLLCLKSCSENNLFISLTFISVLLKNIFDVAFSSVIIQ